MVKLIYYLLLILFFQSCISISNKNNLINLNSIGNNGDRLKLNGYYYQTRTIENYPYYKNEYNGYSQELDKPYSQVQILPLILYPNGTAKLMFQFSGLQDNSAFDYKICSLNDENSLNSAFEHFECYLKYNNKDKLNFINKKAEIWNQGVYVVNNNEIIIQIFYNSMGNYYLHEERGTILSDSSFTLTYAKDYQNGKEYKINKKWYFKPMETVPKTESYILKNNKKFKK